MSQEAADEKGGPVKPLRVLAVCTGNICRSPFLEERLAASVAEPTRQFISTSSAGVQAAFGFGRCDRLPEALGIPSRPDRNPVQVESGLLEQFDLILALTTDHRAQLLTISPGLRTRMFTLIEAASIATLITASGHALEAAVDGPPVGLNEHDPLRSVPPLPDGPGERLRWFIKELDAWRGVGSSAIDREVDALLPPAAAEEPDDRLSVPDPHLSARDIHEQTAKVIELESVRLAAAFDAVVSGVTRG